MTHLLVNDAKIRELGLAHWMTLDARQSAVLDDFNAHHRRPLFAYPALPGTPECEVFELAP